ncbi:MAG: phosphate acyltransferase, partial [Melioribacteraceae bacterium]|nr:phosphate acyltransferase [Melioribacteraceae bacterium]
MKHPKKVVYPEGENESIIRAADAIANEGIGFPILIGRKEIIENKISELGFKLENFEIHDLKVSEKVDKYATEYYEKRKRKGVNCQVSQGC